MQYRGYEYVCMGVGLCVIHVYMGVCVIYVCVWVYVYGYKPRYACHKKLWQPVLKRLP